jgi:2-oxoglutarate ferredoxin oxidoreductase subunit beta
MYANQMNHDPGDLKEALAIANREDVLPIGLFYHDPTKPCYEQISTRGLDMTVDEKLVALNTELDRFAI